MSPADLEQARASFASRDWRQAYARFDAADHGGSLPPEDLERLATAAYLVGEEERSTEVGARAHHAFLEAGNVPGAARIAFWLAMELFERGDHAQGGGWLARAHRVLEDAGSACAEQGYVQIPPALQLLDKGDGTAARAIFEEVIRIAIDFGDADLEALGRLGLSRALVIEGKVAAGLASLDEVMVAVTADEVSAVPAGIVYCATISVLRDVYDLKRAREWTHALNRWCEAQPGLVRFRGQCLLERSEIHRLQGAWQEALREAELAREHLSGPPTKAAVGAAFYQLAELHRARGETTKAEEGYREAVTWGHPPHPGLALLRLAQGDLPAADAAIRREVDEAHDPVRRSKLLGAFAEIVLQAGDVAAARAAAEELAAIAASFDAPVLRAEAAHVLGAVLLAEDEPKHALEALRESWTAWRDLDVPFEAARVRVRLGLACRAVGDSDTAEIEFDAARTEFERLGAAPELSALRRIAPRKKPKAAGGLTAREVEVLRLVAAGKTNRGIAEALVISEKTVARHLSNIFTKLGISTRASATAFAYENDLL